MVPPMPPPREVTWSARDNLNYQETAALTALDYDRERILKEILLRISTKESGIPGERA